MHKYVLKLTKYSEEGALTSEVRFEYLDTPQQLADKKSAYDKQRYTSVDDEGKTVIGFKIWKTEPMQAEYVAITDFDEFCKVNKVLA